MEGNSYPSVEYDLDMTYYNYPSGPLSGKPPCVGESEGVYNIGPSTTDYDMYTYSWYVVQYRVLNSLTKRSSGLPLTLKDHWS